jgi:hypothetical protein
MKIRDSKRAVHSQKMISRPITKIRYSCILAGILFMLISGGCANEDISGGSDDGDMATLQFNLRLPYDVTRGLSQNDESRVDEIDVLLFNTVDKTFFSRVSCPTSSFNDEGGNPRKISFQVRLRQGNYDLWIYANAKARLDAAIQAGDLTGKTESVVSGILDHDLPADGKWIADTGLLGYHPIPMWGKADGLTINETTNLQGVNSIRMHRMLARADVTVSASDFLLESVFVYNYIDVGTIAPNPQNWDSNNNIAIKPSGSLRGIRKKGPLSYTAAVDLSSNACTGEIYLNEYSNLLSGVAKDRADRSCLVVGGKWDEHGNGFNDDPVSYYRMDFSTGVGNAEQIQNILRNHHYTFAITKVECKGYDNEEDAFYGTSKLTAEVSGWNLAEQKIVEENYFLKVSKDEFIFNAEPGDDKIAIHAGHPDGITVDQASISYTPSVSYGSEWVVLATLSSTPNFDGSISKDIQINVNRNSGAAVRKAIIEIKAGNLTKRINVTQNAIYTPAHHSGWAGSNIYWDGTKLTFDDVNNTARENYQGVFFKWGSLWGIAPNGSNSSNWGTGITVYKLDSNGNHVASTFGNSWNGFPLPTASITANRNRQYLYEITDASTGHGDICKYLTEKAGGTIHGKKWRMPTSNEFEAAANYSVIGSTPWSTITSNNADGTQAIGTGRKKETDESGTTPFFPAAGYRTYGNGQLYNVGYYGYYWSGSPNSISGYSLYFLSGSSNVSPDYNRNRTFGFPVRCVKE